MYGDAQILKEHKQRNGINLYGCLLLLLRKKSFAERRTSETRILKRDTDLFREETACVAPVLAKRNSRR